MRLRTFDGAPRQYADIATWKVHLIARYERYAILGSAKVFAPEAYGFPRVPVVEDAERVYSGLVDFMSSKDRSCVRKHRHPYELRPYGLG